MEDTNSVRAMSRPGISPNHPHNMALQIWVETGAFGAAIFAIMILMVAFRMPEPRRLGVAGFLAAALAGQFLAIRLSFDLWNDWLWACAGILAAMFVVIARAEAAAETSAAQEAQADASVSARLFTLREAGLLPAAC